MSNINKLVQEAKDWDRLAPGVGNMTRVKETRPGRYVSGRDSLLNMNKTENKIRDLKNSGVYNLSGDNKFSSQSNLNLPKITPPSTKSPLDRVMSIPSEMRKSYKSTQDLAASAKRPPNTTSFAGGRTEIPEKGGVFNPTKVNTPSASKNLMQPHNASSDSSMSSTTITGRSGLPRTSGSTKENIPNASDGSSMSSTTITGRSGLPRTSGATKENMPNDHPTHGNTTSPPPVETPKAPSVPDDDETKTGVLASLQKAAATGKKMVGDAWDDTPPWARVAGGVGAGALGGGLAARKLLQRKQK
jgi:hypothetical protein